MRPFSGIVLLALVAGCVRASPEPNYAAPDDQRHWVADRLSSGHAAFGVLAIKSLPPHDDPGWEGYDAALKVLTGLDALVVDLRGNRGGDGARLVELNAALEPGRFDRPIALIVDEDCSDACRIGFEALRDHPNAKVFDAFDPAMRWLMETVPAAKPVAPASIEIPEAARIAEVQRLTAFGLEVPDGFPPVKPYAEPLSRMSYVVPRALMQAEPQRVFAPALRADLPALRTAMERAYGGWDVAEKHGWDWAAWFEKWDAALASAGETWIPTEQAFAPVRDFQLFQLDNHTTIPLGLRFGAGSRTAVLKDAPRGTCTAMRNSEGVEFALNPNDPAQQVKTARSFDGTKLSDAHYVAFPGNRGQVAEVKCGDAWLEVSELKSVPAPEDRPGMVKLSDEIAYLRLPSFYKRNSEIIARESGSWPKPTGREKALIVDLRGNQGGDVAIEALGAWIPLEELEPLLAFNKRTGASCLYPALRWGYSSYTSGGLTPPVTDGMRRMLQFGLDELVAADDPACPARFEEARTDRHYRDRSGPPRVGKPLLVVLVDGGCGSDCELMTYVLSKLPESVIVGVNTFGVMQFIQPGYSVLPNTKLPFRIALGTSDSYGDNRSTDGYGLDVEVLLDGEAAWTKEGLLRLIEALKP